MDDIMIGIDSMKYGWAVAVPLVFLGIIASVFINSRIVEFSFALLKALFYGMLEFYMWKYVNTKGWSEIGVVSAFTSIFCGLECGDNMVKVISMIIEYIKGWINILKKN